MTIYFTPLHKIIQGLYLQPKNICMISPECVKKMNNVPENNEKNKSGKNKWKKWMMEKEGPVPRDTLTF